ncbi:phosphotransferase family protein [Microbacterium aurum]
MPAFPGSVAAQAEGEASAITRFLSERGICGESARVRPIGDGHSNLTYLADDGARRVVVRRPPSAASGRGYDVLREARILAGLAGSTVPVPRVLAVSGGGVLDVPFLVMSFVEGEVITARTPPPLDNPESRAGISRSLVDTLVDIHGSDWSGTGLRTGSGPFNERHLARVNAIASGASGEAPTRFRPIAAWLASHAPRDSGQVLLHNDYRLGNVLVGSHDESGRISAVLDWELSGVGDPLADLAYLVGSIPGGDLPSTPVREMGAAMLEEGYLDRDGTRDAYADATGRDLSDLTWHLVLAQFKLAALYEFSFQRVRRDPGGDGHFRDRRLVDLFLDAAEAEIPA